MAMIERGAQAPDFELPDQNGNPVRLSALRGRTVVLYFYPKANTCGSICSHDRHNEQGHRDHPR
jgi:peroxiredoxin Q/BCP